MKLLMLFFGTPSEAQIKKFGDTLSRFLYSHCKWRKLERRKYKQGEVHKSGLLEKTKDNNENKTRAKRTSKKLEKRLKDIGNLSLEFINQHQVDHGKDNEWEIAIAINKAAHKAYDEVQEIKT